MNNWHLQVKTILNPTTGPTQANSTHQQLGLPLDAQQGQCPPLQDEIPTPQITDLFPLHHPFPPALLHYSAIGTKRKEQ